MPYSRRTAFFLGGGKAMVNALYATAIKLGVSIGYDSEVVALGFGSQAHCTADIRHDGQTQRAIAKTLVVCTGGHQASFDWLRQSFGAAADNFMIRGTPHDTGSVLRLLLNAGAKPVGDPRRAHMVAVDARGPKFDGGIVTRITAIPHGIVVDRSRQAVPRRGRGRPQDALCPLGRAHRGMSRPDGLSDPGCNGVRACAADGNWRRSRPKVSLRLRLRLGLSRCAGSDGR